MLPFLREQLGGQLTESLARTARPGRPADAEALEAWAHQAWEQSRGTQGINLQVLQSFPPAIGSRVDRAWRLPEAGARNLSSERTSALCALAGVGTDKSRSAGPVQLDGKIRAFRRSSVIVFTTTR